MTLVMYHNPKCSKSRQTLALLRQKGIEPEIVDYMKEPPSVAVLRDILSKLRFDSPRELMRTKEDEYKELGLKDVDDPDALLQAMHDHPRLIERPIVVHGARAALGRPPENVIPILDYDFDRDDPDEPWK